MRSVSMSDKRIYLVLLNELPCPGSHYLHTRKFLEAFANLGYKYGEIKSHSQIQDINSCDIVYISNHGLSKLEGVLNVIAKLGERKANYILWFWHDHLDIANANFGDKYILTGEHFHHKPLVEEHIHRWDIQKDVNCYVPLTFASKLSPEVIGTFTRKDRYLAHFVGANYKKSWNYGLRIQFKNIKIVNTPPFISEEERENIFLSSGVALGWHSDANIQNHVVVERVFEGLAYGNFVISDTPTANEITEGIVETASSYVEAQDWLNRFKKDLKFRSMKQHQGYEWAKSNGTYTNVARRFESRFNS
jgi:hypothetical protein